MKKSLIILFSLLAFCCTNAMASATFPTDINDDGIVSKEDAALIYSFICGTADASITLDKVDINRDGKVNTADVIEIYLKLGEMPTEIPYLTFMAEKEQSMTITLKGSYSLDESLQYSVDNGEWTQLTASTPIKFGGDKGNIRLRGKSATGMATTFTKYAQITFGNKSVPVSCIGDIRTLVDFTNYSTTDTDEALFCYMFNGCSNLITAPELPATDLAERGYY